MECREAAEHLAACVDEPSGLPTGPAARAIDAHLRSCASCRADLENYRRLGAALSGLATHTVEPPAWLLDSVLERVNARRRAQDALTAPRVAAAGGAALLLAGLATGAVLLRGRRRRRGLTTRLRAATAGA